RPPATCRTRKIWSRCSASSSWENWPSSASSSAQRERHHVSFQRGQPADEQQRGRRPLRQARYVTAGVAVTVGQHHAIAVGPRAAEWRPARIVDPRLAVLHHQLADGRANRVEQPDPAGAAAVERRPYDALDQQAIAFQPHFAGIDGPAARANAWPVRLDEKSIGG